MEKCNFRFYKYDFREKSCKKLFHLADDMVNKGVMSTHLKLSNLEAV